MEKLKVEIWSDVMCPFCYIGKRRFENALKQFKHKEEVEVVWKSYQLDPTMKSNTGVNLYDFLAERKGITVEHSKQLHVQMTDMAAELGLEYNFDKAVIANSFDAHRFSHLAKDSGVQDDAEEALFKAYFTQGKNIASKDTLAEIGIGLGLDTETIWATLNSDKYTDAVQHDIYEANQIGVRGVPYFVLGDKYAVSGAQHTDTFLGALQQTWDELYSTKPGMPEIGTGESCSPDDGCAI